MQNQQKRIRLNKIVLFITATFFAVLLGVGVCGLDHFRNSNQQDVCSVEKENIKDICRYSERLSSEIEERSIFVLNFLFFTASCSFFVAGFVYHNHNRQK